MIGNICSEIGISNIQLKEQALVIPYKYDDTKTSQSRC